MKSLLLNKYLPHLMLVEMPKNSSNFGLGKWEIQRGIGYTCNHVEMFEPMPLEKDIEIVGLTADVLTNESKCVELVGKDNEEDDCDTETTFIFSCASESFLSRLKAAGAEDWDKETTLILKLK